MAGYKTWSVGEVLSAASLNTYMVQNDYVIKSADQSVTNNASSAVNDTHLLLNVAANTNYWIEGLIVYSAHSSFDIQIGWTVPSGATFRWQNSAAVDITFASTGGPFDGRCYQENQIVLCTGSTGIDMVTMPKGLLRVGGTAGTIRMQFLQYTAGATASIVRSGSLLRSQRLS